MIIEQDHLTVRLAETERDRLSAERLRYRVFVEELGGDGPLVDHEERLERDRFDRFCEHLVLVDKRRGAGQLDHVVGVYRLMTGAGAAAGEGFYSAGEYDLERLHATGRQLLELGRSCVHPDYRDGLALMRLWTGLGAFVQRTGAEILFGVASFHGTDVDPLAMPLSHLHHAHLAPEHLRVRAHADAFQRMDLMDPAAIDRVRAMRAVPPLIKSYLKLGGFVGEGAFVDRAFNTTDVCLVLDTARLSARDRARFSGSPA
ncbi:MAG: GNAT family N-acetyltransferase [Boseongicola sp.]|nr:GNAT family N-acetyltransferase [Boseongicola sp.]